MRLIKKIDYSLFGVLVLLIIADAVLTAIALPLGAIEMNPMGFNLLSILFTVSLMSAFLLVMIFINYPETPYLVLSGLIILIAIRIWAVVNNSIVLNYILTM